MAGYRGFEPFRTVMTKDLIQDVIKIKLTRSLGKKWLLNFTGL